MVWSRELLTQAEQARCPVQNELLPSIDVASRSWLFTRMEDGRQFGTAPFHGRSHQGLDRRRAQRLRTLHDLLQQAMALHLTIESARAERRSFEIGLDAIFHLELDAHDIVRAEGLLAESWLDTGNRSMFENAGTVVDLRPSFGVGAATSAWATDACAPLVERGSIVDSVRDRLRTRAIALGHVHNRYIGIG